MTGPCRALCCGLVCVDWLNPCDKPARAIFNKPCFAEEEMGSEKGRDLPETTQSWDPARVVLTMVILPLSKLAPMPMMPQPGGAARNSGCDETRFLSCGRCSQPGVGVGIDLDKQTVVTGGSRSPEVSTPSLAARYSRLRGVGDASKTVIGGGAGEGQTKEQEEVMGKV